MTKLQPPYPQNLLSKGEKSRHRREKSRGKNVGNHASIISKYSTLAAISRPLTMSIVINIARVDWIYSFQKKESTEATDTGTSNRNSPNKSVNKFISINVITCHKVKEAHIVALLEYLS